MVEKLLVVKQMAIVDDFKARRLEDRQRTPFFYFGFFLRITLVAHR